MGPGHGPLKGKLAQVQYVCEEDRQCNPSDPSPKPKNKMHDTEPFCGPCYTPHVPSKRQITATESNSWAHWELR